MLKDWERVTIMVFCDRRGTRETAVRGRRAGWGKEGGEGADLAAEDGPGRTYVLLRAQCNCTCTVELSMNELYSDSVFYIMTVL